MAVIKERYSNAANTTSEAYLQGLSGNETYLVGLNMVGGATAQNIEDYNAGLAKNAYKAGYEGRSFIFTNNPNATILKAEYEKGKADKAKYTTTNTPTNNSSSTQPDKAQLIEGTFVDKYKWYIGGASIVVIIILAYIVFKR